MTRTHLAIALSLVASACSSARPPAPQAAGAARRAEPPPATFARDGHDYRLHWLDSFEEGLGDAELGDWSFEDNLARFMPGNVKVQGGALELHLTNEPARGERPYSGAEYARKGSQLYGRFVTRMKPHAPPGVISSFFTAFYEFDKSWNILETAEIDIEFVGTTEAVQFALHWVDEHGKKLQHFESVPLDFDAGADFHDWEIEWLPERVAFYVDGRELYRFTDPTELAELAHPQEVMANVWISSAADWAGRFDASTLPVRPSYDYMAAYTLADAPR